ncbi:hypothetical protein TNCV_4309631 [Trichonephila clavipes]|nr:hypothetical protein TNCV_4309631 [Trichonephila clavipes]
MKKKFRFHRFHLFALFGLYRRIIHTEFQPLHRRNFRRWVSNLYTGGMKLENSTPTEREHLDLSGASNLTRGLAARRDGYLEYPHVVKALNIYKHSYVLRDLNPGPTAWQSASLTTISDRRPDVLIQNLYVAFEF